MTASMVMNSHPTTLRMDETVAAGLKLVMENRFRNIPIIDEDGCYMGIFGIHCLLNMVLPKAVLMEDGLKSAPFVSDTLLDLRERLKDVEDKPITYCMTRDVIAVTPQTPLVETLLALYRSRASVPVVDPDSKRLVGMVSYWDVGQNILAQEI